MYTQIAPFSIAQQKAQGNQPAKAINHRKQAYK
jgi:hypothetical protein